MQDYKEFISVKSKMISISKNNNFIKLKFICYIVNNSKQNLNIKEIFLASGNKRISEIKYCKEYDEDVSRLDKLLNFRKLLQNIKIPIEDISEDDDIMINNSLKIILNIDGVEAEYPLKMKKRVKIEKYNYLPIKSFVINNCAIIFRLSAKQNVVLVKRELEPIEKTLIFKLCEGKIGYFFLNLISKVYRLLTMRKINLYFEKHSLKAEEGTYQLFEKARDNSKKSKNFFIIDKESQQYTELKNQKNVLIKYSLIYYIVLYASHNIISSEAPFHVNILRTKSRTVKKNIYAKKFVFLQHGVTYLKCQGKNSSYVKSKEAEPNIMVVNSKKEAVVVQEMLKLDPDNIIITGMPIFDLVKHNNITNKSKDIVTIMLTWKPYEEHLKNFEDSTYYKYTLNIYDMLGKHMDKKNIKIVPHPKVKEQMMKTVFADSIWEGKISEALKEAKLLITDYSSVCYNSFYQGAGVVFYQVDLELYESNNGQLIPKDNEYIGYRCFDDEQFNKVVASGINNGKINLDYYRKENFVKNYKSINEFSDGKNIERIYSKLVQLKYI